MMGGCPFGGRIKGFKTGKNKGEKVERPNDTHGQR